MNVVFLSNYMTPHQLPFSKEMWRILGDGYHFIQTMPVETERINMGWDKDFDFPFMVYQYEQPELVDKLVKDCDVLIVGGVPIGKWLCFRENKLTFWCSERIYKRGQWRALSPRGFKNVIYRDHFRYKKSKVYALCASAYLPCDMNIFGLYKNKMLKWGYFTEERTYDSFDTLLEKKKNSTYKILWVSRLIELKRCDIVIKALKQLKELNYNFELEIIGNGDKEDELKALCHNYNLEDYVSFCGSMTPNEVRDKMEQADIFVAASNYIEGWGAVINEAMNSGCAVVASHSMGSVPYLIKHKENGLICKYGDVDDYAEKLKLLLDNPDLCREYGERAYCTIKELWNPRNAAENLIETVKAINTGDFSKLPKEGPCSKAPVIKQRKMYRVVTKDRVNERIKVK